MSLLSRLAGLLKIDRLEDAMRADPEFQELVRKNSDPATKLVDKIDVLCMRPTDFSPMK